MELVGYDLRVWLDDQGLQHIDGLERTEQKIIASKTAQTGKEITSRLVAPQIRFVQFQYFSGSEYAKESSGNSLPMAVEIILGTTPQPADMDVEDYLLEYPTYRRVVYVPASTASLQGTVVRGLNGGAADHRPTVHPELAQPPRHGAGGRAGDRGAGQHGGRGAAVSHEGRMGTAAACASGHRRARPP